MADSDDHEKAPSENTSSKEEKEEEEDEESDDQEELEPTVKYTRIKNDMTSILSRDAASCMSATSKFLVLGTHWGMIYIFDWDGNKVRSHEKQHTTTVNQISIDHDGDYIASCSDDGRVVITGLYGNENNQMIEFNRPIKAVAIDPLFSQSGSGKRFFTGDDKLELQEKRWLGRHATVIHHGEGPIRNIRWAGNFVAWVNDLGVKIYDMVLKQRITFIQRDDNKLRPELYRCSLCWKNERTLLIGWGNTVKMCEVHDRPSQDERNLPSRYVVITGLVTALDYMVCGIAPYNDYIALLTYSENEVRNEGGKALAPRPHLRIIKLDMYTLEELSNDALTILGYSEYRANDYRLESLKEECLLFVLSPKDIVLARPRDQDDHLDWLIDYKQFEEALKVAETRQKDIHRHTPQSVGRLYLDYLLAEGMPNEAGRLCVKILGRNKTLWEEQVVKFAESGHLGAIAKYLPLRDPVLSKAVFELVLNDFLQRDHRGFQGLLREWPCEVYNIQTIVNAVQDKLERDRNNLTLLKCLADLYKYDSRLDKALGIYLRLKDTSVFEMISKCNLFDTLSDKIIMLMDVDKEAAIKMLLDNIDKIPVARVYEQLDKVPSLLHIYLDRLFRKDPLLGQDYHARQVSLYAEYEPSRLLTFLRRSSHYPLQGAMTVCEQRHLVPEMVYLLDRMGNTRQALQLIMTEQCDVDSAIEFCKEHSDKELWEDLVNFSIDKPSFITGLLHNIGTHVDPIILIRKIRPGMNIPGLQDSLVRILQDYHLQISLREGCKKILVADFFNLLEKQVRTQRRGLCVTSQQRCQSCQQTLIASDARQMSNVVVFFCQHAYHEDCLPSHNLESCMLCSTQRRGPGISVQPRT